jgi:hypothetical protein
MVVLVPTFTETVPPLLETNNNPVGCPGGFNTVILTSPGKGVPEVRVKLPLVILLPKVSKTTVAPLVPFKVKGLSAHGSKTQSTRDVLTNKLELVVAKGFSVARGLSVRVRKLLLVLVVGVGVVLVDSDDVLASG